VARITRLPLNFFIFWQFWFIVAETTHAKAVGLIVVVQVAVRTVEVQFVPVGTAVLRTAPIVAVDTSVVQRAIAVVEVACGITANKLPLYM